MVTDIGKRVYELLNKQISDGFQTAFTFLSMSGVFYDMGLNGCAKWTKKQFQEKNSQSLMIFDHILLRGGKVRLLPTQAMKQDWRAPLHIFEEIMRIEQRIATSMSAIVDLSIADKDHTTNTFMSPLIQRQAEKESKAAFLLDRLRKMQSTELGVIMFDADMGKNISSFDN